MITLERILICETLEHNVVDIEMKRLQSARISDEISDIVLFLEHSEIVTIGPKARKEGYLSLLILTLEL